MKNAILSTLALLLNQQPTLHCLCADSTRPTINGIFRADKEQKKKRVDKKKEDTNSRYCMCTLESIRPYTRLKPEIPVTI